MSAFNRCGLEWRRCAFPKGNQSTITKRRKGGEKMMIKMKMKAKKAGSKQMLKRRRKKTLLFRG